jgi:hypothetical protein
MTKKPESKPAAGGAEKPQAKRSKLKLALFALVPLVLAGAGYGGWTFYASAAHHPDGDHAGKPDPIAVSAVPTEIAAESSFTHSHGLARIIEHRCGRIRIDQLKTLSQEEARADGMLAALSWEAAARRTAALNDMTCPRFLSEIRSANAKAAAVLEARASADKKSGGH